MGLSAMHWHILCICLFPVIDSIGISGSVFLSSSRNRLLLSSGVIFSAGVLLSAALVHMIPDASKNLNKHFSSSSSDSSEEDTMMDDHLPADGNQTDHAVHVRRILYLERQLRLLKAEDDAENNNAFPWAFAFFGISFLFLLFVEAAMERFIDTYFVGKKGNLFACHGCHDELFPGVAPNATHDENDNNSTRDEQAPPTKNSLLTKVDSKDLAKEDEAANLENIIARSRPVGNEADTANDKKLQESINGDHAKLPASSKELATEVATEKEDTEDGDEETGGNHGHGHDHEHNGEGDEHSKEYIDVKKLHEIFLVKEGEAEHHHCHCHGHEYDELVSPSDAGARSSNIKRHNSVGGGGSQSGADWTKTVPRPSVVSFAVTPPLCLTEEEQIQTINPWVSVLLTIVLSCHVILEGLTIGSSNDPSQIETVVIAVVVHKLFASFSLGSSLVASGYWNMSASQGGRTMFFVLAGVFICLDIVGLGVGMGLGRIFDQGTSFVSGILQSLLAGSFLFVATVELIPGEFEKVRNFNMPLFPILFSLSLGFALMTLLAKWA